MPYPRRKPLSRRNPFRARSKRWVRRASLNWVQTPQQLKEKLDTVFSLYIRLRDGKCLMGEMWGGCNGVIQAGHVISRRHLAIRWDERNCFGQCRSHNYQHTFEPSLYLSWFTKTHGAPLYEELVRLSRIVAKPSPDWLKRRISYFEHRIAELKPPIQ